MDQLQQNKQNNIIAQSSQWNWLYIIIGIILLLILGGGVWWYFSSMTLVQPNYGEENDATLRDMERIGKIKQFQSFLELHFDSHLSYPSYPIMPLTEPITSYNSLPATLAPYGLIINPKDSELGLYYYGVADDWKHYVTGITLEDRKNSALDVDEDGLIFDVHCDDPVFCIKD